MPEATTGPKRRGRKPGSPKVVGSGRRKGVKNIDFDALTGKAESFLQDVMDGKPFTTTGPTGKTIKTTASLDQRLKAALALIDKRHADKKDVTSGGEPLSAGQWTETLRGPFANVSKLSKSERIILLRSLREATRHDPEARSRVEGWAELSAYEDWQETFGDEPMANASPPPDSDPAISVEPVALEGGKDSTAPLLPSPGPEGEPHIGDSIVLDELGGWSCRLDSKERDGRGRWHICDPGGQLHRIKRGDRDEAIATCREVAGLRANAFGQIMPKIQTRDDGL